MNQKIKRAIFAGVAAFSIAGYLASIKTIDIMQESIDARKEINTQIYNLQNNNQSIDDEITQHWSIVNRAINLANLGAPLSPEL